MSVALKRRAASFPAVASRQHGNYPGKARTIEELRGDVEKALSLIPAVTG